MDADSNLNRSQITTEKTAQQSSVQHAFARHLIAPPFNELPDIRPTNPDRSDQERRESNPQPPVLETGALPIELRSFGGDFYRSHGA